MKKIKLTESQIKMIQEHEKSLGKKKVLKITKEHYDALFSTLNESSEVTNNFKKYGKDLGVKYESHPAEGSYKPQSEEENEKTHTSFNESISESIIDVISTEEFKDLLTNAIRDLHNNPSQKGLDPMWVKLGLNWGDFIKLLESFGIVTVSMIGGSKVIKLIKDNDLKPKLSELGSEMLKAIKGEAKKGLKYVGRHIWNMLAKTKRYDMKNNGAVIQDEGLTEWGDGGYPAGAEYDPNAPWNQNDDDYEYEEEPEYIKAEKIIFEPLYFVGSVQDDIMIFGHDSKLFIFGGAYYDNIEQLENYCDISNHEIDGECISNFVNDTYAKGGFKVGVGDGDINNYLRTNVLTVINDKVKEDILKYYGDDETLVNILNGVSENTTTASVGGAYVTPKIWANSKKDMKFAKDPMIKGGKILKEPLSEIDKVKLERFVVEMDMYIHATDKEHAIIEANKIAALINKKYDAHARPTNIMSKNFGSGKLAESIEERTGQVTFDDCVKLDNNKEAQNGGCSVGAVDNVVKVDETVLETVAKQTGKSISEVRDIILKHKTKK